jgi:hypothetical protein
MRLSLGKQLRLCGLGFGSAPGALPAAGPFVWARSASARAVQEVF